MLLRRRFFTFIDSIHSSLLDDYFFCFYFASVEIVCLCVFFLVTVLTVPGRVRVAVRLRPRNADESVADADFADCVELQPEVSLHFLI